MEPKKLEPKPEWNESNGKKLILSYSVMSGNLTSIKLYNAK